MDAETIRWLIGLAVTLTLGWGSILWAIAKRHLDAMKALHDEIDAKHNRLSGELRQVRDEYVKRSELDGHIQRLGSDVRELRNEVRQSNEATTARLDALLVALTKDKAGG